MPNNFGYPIELDVRARIVFAKLVLIFLYLFHMRRGKVGKINSNKCGEIIPLQREGQKFFKKENTHF